MQIPRKYVEVYSRALNDLSEQAKSKLSAALSRIDYSDEPAAIREAVVAAMQETCGASSTMAARLAAEFYDGLRAQFGIDDGFETQVDDGYEPDATEGAVKAFVQDIVDGKPREQFVGKCLGRVDREIRLSSQHCTVGNAARDPKKPRWARIPTGVETCGFCIMLASRGFVYRSEEMASHAHANCDCRIVPSWDKKDPSVEGYDPEEYYDRWKHPEIYEGLDPVTTSSLACLRVAEKHGQVVYEKPLLSFLEKEEDRRDLVAHAALARDGRRFTALAEDSPDGYSNIDLLMDGEKWEVKSPPGDNPRAVESNLRKAKKQAGKNYPEPLQDTRVVFNGYFYGQEDAWVAERLSAESSKHGIAEVLQVGKDGRVRGIEKAQTPYPERPGLPTGRSIAHAASSTEEHRSPKPTTEVRPLGGVPGDPDVTRNRNGLGLGSHRGIAPGTPTLVEVVDFDKTPLEEVLANYEDEIAALEVEHAIIIRPNGEVWRSVGDKRSVNIESDDLDLTGTVVTHNHVVIEEVESSSFSKEDFEQLQQAPEIDELRARYGGYHYSMKPTDKTVDGSWDDARGRLQVGNVSEDIKHDVMVELDAEGIIVYSRERVSSDR